MIDICKDVDVDNIMCLFDTMIKDLGDIPCKIELALSISNNSKSKSIASVKINGIRGELNTKGDFEFSIHYEPIVVVWVRRMEHFINDLYECIGYSNIDLKNKLYTACMENALIHELRHLYQFQNIDITEDDVDMHINDKEKSFGFKFTKDKVFELEMDANDYMLSKINHTTLKDKTLKILYSKMEYNNILLNIMANHGAPSDVLNDIGMKVTECYNELLMHIKENY